MYSETHNRLYVSQAFQLADKGPAHLTDQFGLPIQIFRLGSDSLLFISIITAQFRKSWRAMDSDRIVTYSNRPRRRITSQLIDSP